MFVFYLQLLRELDGAELTQRIKTEKQPEFLEYLHIRTVRLFSCKNLNESVAIAMLQSWRHLRHLSGLNSWITLKDRGKGLTSLMYEARSAGLFEVK